MRIRNIVLILVTTLMISGVVLYSCTRKKVDYLGPEYLSAPSNISATGLTVSTPVDFTIEKCTLSVTFNARVSYKVTYTGASSGATRSYDGVASFVDASSPGGLWDGSHDGINFFRSGETVNVKISFFRSTYSESSSTTITTQRNYLDISNPNIIGLLPSNGYETGLGTFPSQFTFLSIPGCTSGLAVVNSTLGAPEGLNCFQLEGKSCQADGYFIGGIQHRKTGFFLPATWTDPSQIYFNLYVYGEGNKNGRLSLEFHEADLSNDATKPKQECGPPPTNINVGEHDRCTDDAWVVQIPIDHVGWKLISVKYSDMTANASITNGGSGNKIKEPGRVHRIQMGLLSLPTPSQYIKSYMDFPTVTYGAPFDPSK